MDRTEHGQTKKSEYRVKTPKERKAEIRAEKKAAVRASGDDSVRRRSTFGMRLKNIVRGMGGSDRPVIALVIILSVFGAAMIFSASYYQSIAAADSRPTYYLNKDLGFVITGFMLMALFANVDYHVYEKIADLLVILSILLLVLVLVKGDSSHNAQRWLTIPVIGFRITPSELSKLFVMIFTSSFLVKNPENVRSLKGLAILFAVMLVHFYLIFKQPNLSTAAVIVMIMFAIMILGGLNLLTIILPLTASVAGYFYIVNFRTESHWYQRLTSFVDPFADSQGDGYQVTQGLIALGNGGLKGLGFGRSITKNMYLPEPQNDFILAILGEELGYVGFLVLMILYILLLFRLFLIALRAKDRLGFYLAAGVGIMLGLQVVINVAVVTASMPATGITLPFISYGGTSVWTFMIAMGIALNVSKNRKRRETDK